MTTKTWEVRFVATCPHCGAQIKNSNPHPCNGKVFTIKVNVSYIKSSYKRSE